MIKRCRLTETRNPKGKGYRIVEEPESSKSRMLKNDERMNEEKNGRERKDAQSGQLEKAFAAGRVVVRDGVEVRVD